MSVQRILGIETSCDETALALYDADAGLIDHLIYSQVALHNDYGGVVPELAARDHSRKLPLLTKKLLERNQLEFSQLDLIAYTIGPGLIGALMTGAVFGRSLAYALGKPAIGVHHMEGHLLAPMLSTPKPEFPFVCLLVSGGHTLLVKVAAIGDYEILGESLDDAAGEAFDKTAKLLGLSYPGGPALARLAEQGDPKRFHLTHPMINRPGLDFSFSGLKTQVANLIKEHGTDAQSRADIAAVFQVTMVETLVLKVKRALEQTGLNRLVIAGGVSANSTLRQQFEKFSAEKGSEVFYPLLEFCTDNAAMIAYAGYERWCLGQQDDLSVSCRARWPLTHNNN